MTDMENILGFDFRAVDEYIDTGVFDPRWLDSEEFSKLKTFLEKEHPEVEIIKIKSDKIFVHKSYLLEFVRFYDFEKYIIMIENATDGFFDSGKIIPTVVKKDTVFGTLRDLINI